MGCEGRTNVFAAAAEPAAAAAADFDATWVTGNAAEAPADTAKPAPALGPLPTLLAELPLPPPPRRSMAATSAFSHMAASRSAAAMSAACTGSDDDDVIDGDDFDADADDSVDDGA